MPFLDQICTYINDTLKAGSLNKERLKPATFYGLSTVLTRSTDGSKEQSKIELLPSILSADGKSIPIAPDSKKAIQIYHKLLSNTYGYEKKSHGDGYNIKSTSELALVVITNSKLTGITKDAIEPVVVFGLPQRLSTALLAEIKINTCLITPLASNMDHVQVFGQEFPRNNYFINEQMSMFLIRYRIEMTFSQACVEQCLCD